MDIEFAKFSETPKFVNTHGQSADIIAEHSDALISAYYYYEQQKLEKRKDLTDAVEIQKQTFQSKRCFYCGEKLKYISSYDFWGCSNYKDPGQHSTFSKKDPVFNYYHVNIPAHWIPEIIDELQLKGKLTAKPLYEFYIGMGLEDLRTKYGYRSSLNVINSLTKTKRASVEQELKALKHLQSIFTKVVYQQCISYKIKGEKEKFCIPDFICGSDEEVYVIDAKLDACNDTKMLLYISLVSFITSSKKDKRPVNGGHIMYAEHSYQPKSEYKIFYLPKF